MLEDNKLLRCLGGDIERIRWLVSKGLRWQLCRLNHDDIGHFAFKRKHHRELRITIGLPKC